MNNQFLICEENIEQIHQEWGLLYDRTPLPIFLSREWMAGWCSRLLRKGEQPLIVTARREGCLMGIAPLMILNQTESERVISFIGQDYSYGLGFIVDGKVPEEYFIIHQLLVRYLFDHFIKDGTKIFFRHMASDPALISAIRETSCRIGFRLELGYQDPSQAIPLPDTFENYLKHGITSRKCRSTIPAQMKRLEAVTNVRFYLSPPDQFDLFWNELLRFHRATMQIRGKESALTAEDFPGHLVSFALSWPDPGSLKQFNLDFDGLPAVRLLGVVRHSVFFGLTMGINPAVRESFPRYNLAVLSQVYCIRHAISEGCTQFDMLGGNGNYKARMGGREHSGMTLEVAGQSTRESYENKEVALVTNTFLRSGECDSINLGGVEVWLLSMAHLLISMGNTPTIFQGSDMPFNRFADGIEVLGFNGKNRGNIDRKIHEEIRKRGIGKIIYASSFVGQRHFIPGNVFIQHGIHWDYPTGEMGVFDRFKWKWIRRKLARQDLKMALASQVTIAVDTAFINYYRTVTHDREWASRVRYVPNFAIPQDKREWQHKWQNPGEIHLAFTRRFVLRRGIVIFCEALEKLLATFPEIRVTLAGDGLYKPWVEEKFRNHQRVCIQELSHDKVYHLLKTVHIAVIPSTYSEGTSLACLEAMASGCAIVSTTTGGLGNLIFPGFNGLIARPEAGDLIHILSQLIRNPERARKMADNGYRLIQEAFSHSVWEQRMKEVLSYAGL